MSSGLGGLNKSPNGVVIGLAQLALPDPHTRAELWEQTQKVVAMVGKARRSVAGHPSGAPQDSQDTLAFSALRDIEARIETYPLADVNEAYARMINNEARFRVVLTMD